MIPRDRVAVPGEAADDSARLGSLLGACWGNGSLIRLGSASPGAPGDSLRWTILVPVIRTSWNSRIPDTRNGRGLWAGRGVSTAVLAGAQASYRRIHVVLAPEIYHSQNSAFPVLAAPDGSHNDFASPWFSGEQSADLPVRFGATPYRRMGWGESSLELTTGAASIGLGAQSQWWGPGLQNGVVMSTNAAGIQRLYIRTARPLTTRVGTWEGQWMLGGLTESPFFDSRPRNDQRTVSGAVVTLRLAADTGLTLGVERVVYASARNFGAFPSHAADVFLDWSRAPAVAEGDVTRRSDQLNGLFARWVFATTGLAVHAEWARLRIPGSIRELVVEPQSGQGYTVGLEWARKIGSASTLRLQGETTTLEQTPPVARAVTTSFYTSSVVPQGYTNQGQAIGASIGPGSSSQHLGATFYRQNMQAGVSAGRIRWSTDAYYRSPNGFGYRAHDISLYAAIMARYDARWLQLDGEVVRTTRYNFLFQSENPFLYGSAFNIRNMKVTLKASPRF